MSETSRLAGYQRRSHMYLEWLLLRYCLIPEMYVYLIASVSFCPDNRWPAGRYVLYTTKEFNFRLIFLSLFLPIPPTSLVASITIIAKFGAAIGCSSEPPLCLALFAQQCLTKIENSSFYCIHCLRHHHLFSSNLWPNRRKDCVCIERWTKDLSEWNLQKSPQIFSWHCFPCMRKMNLCGNELKTMKMCSILHLFFLPQQ